MPECPRCHQSVETQAITCPHCRMVLKAYGHPGIPLFRADGNESLCITCAYHEDDTCNFPQRPDAKECTLYTDRTKLQAMQPGYAAKSIGYGSWFKRNLVWIALLGLVILSFVLAFLR